MLEPMHGLPSPRTVRQAWREPRALVETGYPNGRRLATLSPDLLDRERRAGGEG